ncbi:hypothetical protein ACXWTF_13090 [Thiomicrolovo sp. ZZH C-3]
MEINYKIGLLAALKDAGDYFERLRGARREREAVLAHLAHLLTAAGSLLSTDALEGYRFGIALTVDKITEWSISAAAGCPVRTYTI